MADWLAARQEGGNSMVRATFSAQGRLSRRKRGHTGRLRLSRAQRQTILAHTSLPDELVARFIIEESGQRTSRLSEAELSLLEEQVGEEALNARGSVRRQLLRIAEKLAAFRRRHSGRVQDRFQSRLAHESQRPISSSGNPTKQQCSDEEPEHATSGARVLARESQTAGADPTVNAGVWQQWP
jgi:hypothetical protein